MGDSTRALSRVEQFHRTLETQQEKLASLLPAHVPIERFVQAARISASQEPDIMRADATSVFLALSACASDGLVPDGSEAAVTVFNDRLKGLVAAYMPMKRGILKLCQRSPDLAGVDVAAVYEHDAFGFRAGDGGHIHHTPFMDGSRGAFRGVYLRAEYTTGFVLRRWMPKADVDKRKNASREGRKGKGPWVDWYEEMALKSILHACADMLPISARAIDAIKDGDARDAVTSAREATGFAAALNDVPNADGATSDGAARLEDANAPAEPDHGADVVTAGVDDAGDGDAADEVDVDAAPADAADRGARDAIAWYRAHLADADTKREVAAAWGATRAKPEIQALPEAQRRALHQEANARIAALVDEGKEAPF